MATLPVPSVITAALLAAAATPAFASPFFIIQKDTRFTQTSSAAPTTPNGFDFFATVMTPGVFDGGTTTVPVNSDLLTLSPASGELQFASGVISSQSTFNSDFPTGVYSFHLTQTGNPGNTQDQTVDDSAESFATTVPALTPASFNALPNLDPTKPFTVNFNTFTAAAPPFNGPLAFFAIVDSGNNVLLEDGVQITSPQDTIPANTLQAGATYRYTLFFSQDLDTTNTQLQLNLRTQGTFTVGGAIPEPASACLALLGLAAIYRLRRRSSRS